MKIDFTGIMQRANRTGTGIIYIPKEKYPLLNLGDKLRVKLIPDIWFFAKLIKYSRLGIYVPKNIVEAHELMKREAKVRLKKIKGFYAPVSSDGRIYIPDDIARNKLVHQDDVVLIKAMDNNKVIYRKYAKIYITQRPKRKRKEFICYVDKMLQKQTLEFQIEKLPQAPLYSINPIASELLQKMYYGFIGKNRAIIFRGNKAPALINLKLELSNLAFYLGAYFADGTKKGNSWAICASTFKQARYYLKMHNLLVKDSKPELTISYTNIYNIEENKLKKDLAEIWQKEVGIKVNKFRIRKPSGKSVSKWNKYGTLIIREHRQILLDFYNSLLKSLINEILLKEDKKLAIDFICGVMEGDGCVPAKKRGHITISTNKTDIPILKSVIRITQIKFKVIKEGENKYGIRIGTLEILRNLSLLKGKVFILYPKRRTALFERLKTVGATKFLIGNHELTNWVKVWLKNNGFSDENYEITAKGLNFGKILLTEMGRTRAK